MASARCSPGHWQPLHQTDLRAGASGIWCLPLPEQGVPNPGDFNREQVWLPFSLSLLFPLSSQTGNDKSSKVTTVTCGGSGNWTVGLSPDSGPCHGSRDTWWLPLETIPCLPVAWLAPAAAGLPGLDGPFLPTSHLLLGLWPFVGPLGTGTRPGLDLLGVLFSSTSCCWGRGAPVSRTRTGNPLSHHVHPAGQLRNTAVKGLSPRS